MNTVFLYPCSPLNVNKVDECYQEEYEAAKGEGLIIYLINIGALQTYKDFWIPSHVKIVYRGWMLNETEYNYLEQIFGNQLITSKQDYFNAHHLPNWYNEIFSLTIRSLVTDEQNVYEDFTKFSKAFIKDFAKSLKTGKGSIIYNQEDIPRALNDMIKYRGVIEGGIVLREVIDLVPNSEVRFFVINNKVFNLQANSKKYLVAEEVVEKLKCKNLKFYSIDIATTINGKNIVIEVGDGQVSDYVGWNIKDFVHILSKI